MSEQPAPRKARVISDPYAVRVALDRIGMPKELLLLAAEKGHLERRLATPLDFAGRGEYDAASRALRTLCEEGGKTAGSWHREQYLGIPVAFNLDESIAITVTAGDEYAGVDDGERDPRTRTLKGPNTRTAVARQTLPLVHPEDEDAGVEMWYLLTNVTAEALLVELARAEMLDLDGRITGWAERIIVGQLDLDGDGAVLRGKPTEPTPPVEINLRRKSG
jgi:hypothetical protein